MSDEATEQPAEPGTEQANGEQAINARRDDRQPDKGQPKATTTLAVGCFGALFGLAVALYIMTRLYGSDLELVTQERYDEARTRWEEAGLRNYRMTVEVSLAETNVYEVEVVDSVVTSLKMNGNPLKSRRTFHTWSVPGMFDTVKRDLEQIARFESGERVAKITLNASFHPEYGFPTRGVRVESRRAGGNQDASWTVIAFEPQ